MIRYDAGDPGQLTEFKTLNEGRAVTIKHRILKAGKQLAQHGGGDAAIDGRQVGLSEDTAREGYELAVRQARHHGQALPRQVRIILADGRILTLREG